MKRNDPFARGIQVVEAAAKGNVTLRLLGAVAFKIHCPKYGFMQERLGRTISDLDFAAYRKDRKGVDSIFYQLGFQTDIIVSTMSSGKRAVFYDSGTPPWKCDIFYDKLEMCHDIKFENRLERDSPTITLVDLLLEKMQIVRLESKDIIDTIMLLREHEIGQTDNETVHSEYLAKLCSEDWGLWKTVTTNLAKVQGYMTSDAQPNLGQDDITDVSKKLASLLSRIEQEPKSKNWEKRAKVGEKKKWYREVEEMDR